MSITVEEVSDLQEYIRGVLDRADHHASTVDEIVPVLVGLVIWKKDPPPIRVMTREGHTTNVLWVSLRGVKYAFVYNHAEGTIEMRVDSLRGSVAHTFTNKNTPAELKKIFETM